MDSRSSAESVCAELLQSGKQLSMVWQYPIKECQFSLTNSEVETEGASKGSEGTELVSTSQLVMKIVSLLSESAICRQ